MYLREIGRKHWRWKELAQDSVHMWALLLAILKLRGLL